MQIKKQLDYFLKHATIYEVNLRQYTNEGTIAAFMLHLPRLKKMGIDIIWLMPIHPIGEKNRKGNLGSYYSIRDYLEINPAFGTKSDFKKLVELVHELEMKIIIDWVANHAAWDNKWTLTNPDYFSRNAEGQFLSPYDWSDVIQIDHNNEMAHDALRDAMCFWVKEFDIDGFRADLAHLTPLKFWIKAKKMTTEIKPDLIWLAETEDAAYHEVFDISYAWKWMHQSESFLKENQPINQLWKVLKEENNKLPQGALQLFFTTNHDENSWNGTEYEKYGIYAKALAVFSFLYPYSVPLIYSGQEIPNKKRLKFFDKDQLDWSDHDELGSFYQTLITQRKKNKTEGLFEIIQAGNRILAFKIGSGIGSMMVFLNLDFQEIDLNYHSNEPAGNYLNVMSSESIYIENQFNTKLNPGAHLILEKMN